MLSIKSIFDRIFICVTFVIEKAKSVLIIYRRQFDSFNSPIKICFVSMWMSPKDGHLIQDGWWFGYLNDIEHIGCFKLAMCI